MRLTAPWTIWGDILSRIDWSRLHESNKFHILTLPLALMSFLYGLGVRLKMITSGSQKKILPGFVVSIGNITAGGTGKTPAARMMAEWALKQGFKAAILSRGYGGNYGKEVFIVSDGEEVFAGPEKAGDEPYLLALGLKGVPVIVSRDRFSAGMTASRKLGADFFILDDGFQHTGLHRDMDIVLMDATSPFGNGHLLPWGPLREPVSNIKRADAIIFTRAEERNIKEMHKDLFNPVPRFGGDHIPEKFCLPFEQRDVHPLELKGKRIIAFAGIAKPRSFKETLLKLGAEILLFKTFRDHHSFTMNDIEQLKQEKERLKAEYLVTTEKDWVKIRGTGAVTCGFGYLTIQFAVTEGHKEFFDMIKKRAVNRFSGLSAPG